MHLMVGSIQAAAVPQGALEVFLAANDRSELTENFYRITVPNPLPKTMIFLRQDWYSDPLKRTIISETWLRDALPSQLQLVPQTFSFIAGNN